MVLLSRRATWLWLTSYITTQTGRTTILTYSVANTVNTIYLQIDTTVDASYYQSFISSASLVGIQVEALIGEPTFASSPVSTSGLQTTLDWITAYQAKSTSAQDFSGIHVDIEPYVLSTWTTNQTSLIAGWQAAVTNITATAKKLSINAAADIPFWLNTLNATGTTTTTTLDAWMMQQYNYTVILAYRNTATAALGVAANAIAAAQAAKKPIIFAAETRISAEGTGISYYGKTALYLEAQLASLIASLLTYPSVSLLQPLLAGVAVHDVLAWQNLTLGLVI